MGSADWMPRNLDKRVEILFPVEDVSLKEEVIHIMDILLRDNKKAREMQADGTYKRVARRGKEPLSAQEYFCEEALANTKRKQHAPHSARKFEPLTPPEENDDFLS